MEKKILILATIAGFSFVSCNSEKNSEKSTESSVSTEAPLDGGSATIEDDISQRNVLQVAVSSKDHTTLVAAVKAAELVDVLATVGPFTVFAPTNAAFEKLPAGTVEGLLKPDKKGDLQDILEYHVIAGGYSIDKFKDGQTIGVANGERVNMGVKDGKVTVNGANIIASISCANGTVHVIDAVLLPPVVCKLPPKK